MCVVFKQKTAYEMRISDWSSDVCSSDLDFSNHPGPWPICAFPWSCRSYQGSVILTDEDGFWRFSARRLRWDDVGDRTKQARQSQSRQKPPAGLPVPTAGPRRAAQAVNPNDQAAPTRPTEGIDTLPGAAHRNTQYQYTERA